MHGFLYYGNVLLLLDGIIIKEKKHWRIQKLILDVKNRESIGFLICNV